MKTHKCIKVIIDNGHGVNTKGKCSPDGKFREWSYVREIAREVETRLKELGVDAVIIVPEDDDVPLRERVERVNDVAANADGGAILVSIHCNAKGMGRKWEDARGWCVMVGHNHSQQSKLLAEALADVAKTYGVKVRSPSPNKKFWVSSLYICQRTRCPAVLVENFFQDNREDVKFLISSEGKEIVTSIIVGGVCDYLNIDAARFTASTNIATSSRVL